MSASAVGYIKDMLSFIHGGFRDARNGQTAEQLHFVPDGESHSVAWVLWHAARVEDLLVQGAWQGKQEIWREGNWAEKTGLPERGFGTGQSTEEASAVAIGDMDAFWGYQDAVNESTHAFLDSLSDDDLAREVKLGEATETLGQSITLHLCTHLNGHRGEINLIRGMHGLDPVRPNMGG